MGLLRITQKERKMQSWGLTTTYQRGPKEGLFSLKKIRRRKRDGEKMI
jgi:hypothetical protein